MLDWLALPPGAAVLDAGCGPGAMLPRLAAAVGPTGSVVGLDINERVLAMAQQVLADANVASVTLQHGSLLDPPFETGRFDLVWASHVLHHILDPVAALRALRRVTRPGGRIVICEGGVPLRFLPFDLGIGEPGLQDRLRVAQNRWFATIRYGPPTSTPYPAGWLAALHDAGCQNVTARTFMLERQPPFSTDEQDYLRAVLRMWLDDATRRAFVDPADLAVLEALTETGGPHDAMARNDLHVLSGLALYVGEHNA